MKAYRVDRQGRMSPDFELALVREGKAFAYLVPAERTNVNDRLSVVEMAKPLEGLQELYEAAEKALAMLQRVQAEEEGPGVMPWPEIDRLDLAIKGMGI